MQVITFFIQLEEGYNHLNGLFVPRFTAPVHPGRRAERTAANPPHTHPSELPPCHTIAPIGIARKPSAQHPIQQAQGVIRLLCSAKRHPRAQIFPYAPALPLTLNPVGLRCRRFGHSRGREQQ